MEQSNATVPWSVFNTVATALGSICVLVVAGGFAWLHGDLGDVRTDLKELRGSVSTISNRIQDTREDVVKAVAAVQQQAGITNTKLDMLIEKSSKSR